jgi:hypothetical protein
MPPKSHFDRWHYARPQLAARMLQTFDLGLTAARGLFARRRMGKTEFLKKDLIPAAQREGYLTAYVNLWTNRAAPAEAVIEAIALALEPHTGYEKLLAQLKRPVSKLKASARVAGVEGSVEADLALPPSVALSALAAVLQRLDKQSHPLLLVLDEAQVLAHAAHADLSHALRAELDTRKDAVKVVFAGSSEATLRRMFAVASEPFYNWASLEPFELLGREFVEALVERVNRITRYPLSLASAQRAFKALDATPEFFRRYLEQYVIDPQAGSPAALARAMAQVNDAANFVGHWDALLPADRELLRMLAAGRQDLHGESARADLAERLGLAKAAMTATVANALRRLQAANVLAKVEHGIYQFEDAAFERWVRDRDATGATAAIAGASPSPATPASPSPPAPPAGGPPKA